MSQKVAKEGRWEVRDNFSPGAVLVTKSGVQVNLLSCVVDEVGDAHGMISNPEWQLDPAKFPDGSAVGSPTDDATSTMPSSPSASSSWPSGSGKAQARMAPGP